MDKIKLNDKINTHDAIAHGVVEMKRLEDGKVLFKKNNMITLTGRKLIFNKMFGSSNNNLSHIFIGDGYNVTYAEMTWKNISKSSVNYYELTNENKSYNLLGESSNTYTYINNIDYTAINSLVFTPAKSVATNLENDLLGKYISAFNSTAVISKDNELLVQVNGPLGLENYDTGLLIGTDTRYEPKVNKFITIDNEYAFARMDDIENFKTFLKYFNYVFDYKPNANVYTKIDYNTPNDIINNFLTDDMKKTLSHYIPMPYVENATYDVDSLTGLIEIILPGTNIDSQDEGSTTIVLNTPANISNEPFLKITKVFDGNDINKSITELGLLYSDSTKSNITDNDLELFSRVIFESIPMISGNTFEVSYYIYF